MALHVWSYFLYTVLLMVWQVISNDPSVRGRLRQSPEKAHTSLPTNEGEGILGKCRTPQMSFKQVILLVAIK